MDRVERFRRVLAEQSVRADPVLRIGLGIVILLAGGHKLVDPGAWTVYVAPPFQPLPVLSWTEAMIANGIAEVAFGGLLLADRYTVFAAAVVSLSLVGVAVDLVVLLALTGEGADILIRDLGLVALAVGVTLNAAATGPPGKDDESAAVPDR